ncbi:hypothetical protein Tco_0092315 [Tanacetum coccineum]
MYLSNIERIIVARAHHDEEMRTKERDVKERRDNKKRVNILEMQKQERMINARITSDASLDSTEKHGKCRSSRENTDDEDGQISKDDSGIDNAIAGAHHDKVKITKVHDSQFMSDYEQSCHVQPNFIQTTYLDDQIDSIIKFDDSDIEDDSGNVKMETLMRNV